MTDREDRIREIAYFMWLDAGSPEGEAERHWLAAEGLVEPDPVDEERNERGLPDGAKKPSPSRKETGAD